MNAQCKASYLFYQNGKTVTFYDSTLVNVANPSFYWSFGDGTTDTGVYATHTYATYGTYYVCHAVYAANCADTICDSIVIAAPSCRAMFKDYSNGLQCYFYNGSSSISGSPTYYWNFGDGNSSTQEHPSHSYSASGTYTVCLYENDSAGNCSDSICQQVVISTQNTNTCSAVNKYYFQNGTAYFYGPYNSNGAAYSSYYWDFGDGTSSTQHSPTHLYNGAGPYLVCLTVNDSGCSDTYCDSLYNSHNGGGSCNVYYTDSSYGDTTAFNASVKGTNGTVTYAWDFGDGTSSMQQNPIHIYPSAGYYYCCVKITDSSCTSSYCDYINKGSNNGRYAVMGRIYAGNTFVYPAMVWAINYDSAAGTLTGVDSTITDSLGFYYFSVSKGFYLIKAAMDASNVSVSNFMPTYYMNKLTWDSATQLQVDTDYYNINIDLLAGNNPGGPGFIGGKTSQGANKTNATGDPVNQVQINLLDANKEAVAYTYSDANGDFKFSNIAYGTYYIHPEMPGKKSFDIMVTISASTPSVNTIFVEVNKKYVSASLTGINSVSGSDSYRNEIWPNPATENIYIKSNTAISNIYITDITGKHVLDINKSENTINISSLDAGIYIMQIITKEGMLVPYKFVKQ